MASSSSPQRAQARRALIADIKQDKRTWLRHGAAALAISVLGLGVAASVALTGSAQNTVASTDPGISVAPQRTADSTSRDTTRPALDAKKLKSLADQRAEELNKTEDAIDAVASAKTAKARKKALASASAAARREAARLAEGGKARTKSDAPKVNSAKVASGGKSCLPVERGYRIAARFGQTGSWSRYHTGFDFSAPVGTPLHASASGVVLNAGIGPASGWAGNYVAIRHADGTQTLLAHMSGVSVSKGQTVSACQVVGAVGMTGRTFGPHVHFEVYPAGITPGDVYKAVNPAAWFSNHSLRP
ncbi:MAG TPA: M23 family metallopeptidase [Propionibacteriaceae bacterium]|nr:M23 family metallopeptidase [Propionibacteriaceae bacterium]